MKQDNIIYDKKGNPIGVKTKLQPSGDTVVHYPAYMKHNADKAEQNQRRRVALGLGD